MNNMTKVTNGMLFQDVIQCATFNCVSHRSRSSHKLSPRIIDQLLCIQCYVLCLKTINYLISQLDYRVLTNLKCSIWPSVSQFVEVRPAYRTCSTLWGAVPKLWNCSKKSGTFPQKVELFHKKKNCSTLCRSSWILPSFHFTSKTGNERAGL